MREFLFAAAMLLGTATLATAQETQESEATEDLCAGIEEYASHAQSLPEGSDEREEALAELEARGRLCYGPTGEALEGFWGPVPVPLEVELPEEPGFDI